MNLDQFEEELEKKRKEYEHVRLRQSSSPELDNDLTEAVEVEYEGTHK